MMVFLVDFVARGLHMGTHMAALFWIVYGIGATVGPMVYGMLGDRLGIGNATRLSLAVQVAAAAALVLDHHSAVLVAATFVIGTFPPGIVPLTLGRIRQTLRHDVAAQGAAWSRATTVFALFQALAGYAYSWLFAATGGHHAVLLAIGAAALALALLSDLLLARAAWAVVDEEAAVRA
jgi:predicted MFS family arabinose efflux permease